MRRPVPTGVFLCLACAAAAAMLAASQFMDIFHLTPPGGEALDAITSSDQHGAVMLIVAVVALAMVLLALTASQSPREGEELPTARIAAFAIAACGVVALLIFLVIDLPDVNKIGTVDDPRESFIDAKAEPQAGFWFELFGSLLLAACGIALATSRQAIAEQGPLRASGETARARAGSYQR